MWFYWCHITHGPEVTTSSLLPNLVHWLFISLLQGNKPSAALMPQITAGNTDSIFLLPSHLSQKVTHTVVRVVTWRIREHLGDACRCHCVPLSQEKFSRLYFAQVHTACSLHSEVRPGVLIGPDRGPSPWATWVYHSRTLWYLYTSNYFLGNFLQINVLSKALSIDVLVWC